MELVKAIEASVSAYKEDPFAKHEEQRQLAEDLLIQRFQEWRNKYDPPKVEGVEDARHSTLADLATPPKNADDNCQVSIVIRPLPFAKPLADMALDFLVAVCRSAALMLRAEGIEIREAIKKLHQDLSKEVEFTEEHLWRPALEVADIDRACVSRLRRNV